MKRTSSLAALFAYLAISATFFAPSLRNNFASEVIGSSADPTFFMWCFKWWPYAIAHGLNPFFTHLVSAPTGVNLTWTTCIPLVALAVSPITELWGPVPAYNLACLVAPALAAWSAFQLCVYLTRRFWPAFAGGYIFGFSTFILAQLRAHLFLTLVFPIPLMVLVVVRRLGNEISASAFVGWLTLLLLTQFLISVEMVATLTLFGGFTLLLALIVYDSDTRRRILSMTSLIAASYASLLALASPYIYYMFAKGFPHGAIFPGQIFSADLVNFAVPTHVNFLGTISWFEEVSRDFRGNIFEDSAYLGWPLILVALWFGISRWRAPTARLMLISLLLICTLAMGQILHIDGVDTIWLPWRLFSRLPLLSAALPCRFVVYAFLVLAIITALYLSELNRLFGAILTALVVIGLLPNFDSSYWSSPTRTPSFFADGTYKKYLQRDDVVYVLPLHDDTNSMLWQAETDMYYRMAGGYTGLDQDWSDQWRPQWSGERCEQLEFLARTNVKAIVVSPWRWTYYREDGPWEPRLEQQLGYERSLASQMRALGLTGSEVDDVQFYPLPEGFSAPFVLPHDEVEARIVNSIKSRIEKAVSYAAQCVPESAPSSGIAADLRRRLNAAAAPPADDPYSCDSRISVTRGSAGSLLLFVGAPKEHLVRLEAEMASSLLPADAMRTAQTGESDALMVVITLSRAQLLTAASHLKESHIPCDR